MKKRTNRILLTILFLVAGTPLKAGPCVDNGDGTVSDQASGLYWQKCVAGTMGNCSPPASMNWQSALQYCDSLTLAGLSWRLPSVVELYSVDDATNFPNDFLFLWTSTTRQSSSSYAYGGLLLAIHEEAKLKSTSNYVRCVSSGP